MKKGDHDCMLSADTSDKYLVQRQGQIDIHVGVGWNWSIWKILHITYYCKGWLRSVYMF